MKSQRLKTISGLLLLAVAALLVIDYAVVRSKERQLSSAVSAAGGTIGSIPAWPIGTEYRISFSRALTDDELDKLGVANRMRGWVGVAFNCQLSASEVLEIQRALPQCYLHLNSKHSAK